MAERKSEVIEYCKHLKTAKQIGDRKGEKCAYSNLGNAHHNLGNFEQAIEYHSKHLSLAKEEGDRAGEGCAYSSLGNAHQSLGNFQKAWITTTKS